MSRQPTETLTALPLSVSQPPSADPSPERPQTPEALAAALADARYVELRQYVRVPERPETPCAAACYDAHYRLMDAWLRANDTEASDTERQTAYREHGALVLPAADALREALRVLGSSASARRLASDGETAAVLAYRSTAYAHAQHTEGARA